MCSKDFCYVLIGKDNKYMILCRQEDYDLNLIREAIRHAFPALPNDVEILVRDCHKMFSSQFECQVRPLEASNWGSIRFIALQIVEKDNVTYCCRAKFFGNFSILPKRKLKLLGFLHTKPKILQKD